jgi:membrane glycosyltransferase
MSDPNGNLEMRASVERSFQAPSYQTHQLPGIIPSRAAKLRRITFFIFVGMGTILGTGLMWVYLSAGGGMRWAEYLFLLFFIPLYYQLNVGFFTALFGVWIMNRAKKDPYNLWDTIADESMESPIEASTAIIMPVFNEDVSRIFEGLRATYESLQLTGHGKSFDFFILSDSDNTSQWIEEETAWIELCRQLNAFGRIFYRKRRKPINRKSGNVSDFCRRWGKRYRYMLVLDADSLMSGNLMTSMTRIMEKNPGIGILQTFPKQVGATTLLGRLMQFAQALYGAPFMAGLEYWQGNEANFWGHNAIIRLLPFIENCALPALPGKEPFGGHILSHDFVEAALMRKAGYSVRLLNSPKGSYEEGPPSLVDMLKRDRRWCQGNMQHFWLLFARGFHPMSRINFLHGILSYASSLFWFIFLILTTYLAWHPNNNSLQANLAQRILLMMTVVLIFLPKAVIIMDELITGRLFDPLKMRVMTAVSAVIETVIFSLLAPILMIFHAKFVVYTVLGKGVKWVTQRRKVDGSVDWAEVFYNFWHITAIGVIWGGLGVFLGKDFFVWFLPILISLLIAIPLAIFVSSVRTGKRFSLFITPEENRKPQVMEIMDENINEIKGRMSFQPELEKHYGLMQACLDPYINGLHISLLRRRKNIEHSKEYLAKLTEKLLHEGPSALKPSQLKAMMHDTDTVTQIHYQLWSSTDDELAPFWLQAIRQYNLAANEPFSHLLAQRA